MEETRDDLLIYIEQLQDENTALKDQVAKLLEEK